MSAERKTKAVVARRDPRPAVLGPAAGLVGLAVVVALIHQVYPGITSNPYLLRIIALLAGLFALKAAWNYLDAKSYVYTVDFGEKVISYEHGVVLKRREAEPFDNILEVSYYEGLAEKIFGLGSVAIITVQGEVVALRSIPERVAKAIHKRLAKYEMRGTRRLAIIDETGPIQGHVQG